MWSSGPARLSSSRSSWSRSPFGVHAHQLLQVRPARAHLAVLARLAFLPVRTLALALRRSRSCDPIGPHTRVRLATSALMRTLGSTRRAHLAVLAMRVHVRFHLATVAFVPRWDPPRRDHLAALASIQLPTVPTIVFVFRTLTLVRNRWVPTACAVFRRTRRARLPGVRSRRFVLRLIREIAFTFDVRRRACARTSSSSRPPCGFCSLSSGRLATSASSFCIGALRLPY